MKYLKAFIIWFIVLWIGFSLFSTWQEVNGIEKHNNDTDVALKEILRRNTTLAIEIAKWEGILKRAQTSKVAAEARLTKEKLYELDWKKSWWTSIPYTEKREEANRGIEKARNAQKKCLVNIAKSEKTIAESENHIQELKQNVAEMTSGDEFKKIEVRLKQIVLDSFKGTLMHALIVAAVMAFFLPVLWVVLAYYLLAPVLNKWQPFCPIHTDVGAGNAPKGVSGEVGEKNLRLTLEPGETITVRSEEYVSLRQIDGMEHDFVWIYNWHYLIMSICCKLMNLVSYTASGDKAQELSISSDNPDEYFCSLELPPGEKLVILPSDLIAFSRDVILRSRWIFSPHAFCTGQVRFFILEGPKREPGQRSARIVIRSYGGVTAKHIDGSGYAAKKHCIITASAGVCMGARRTESFWNYYGGHADLFDLQLSGTGEVLIHNAQMKPTTLTEKTMKFFLNAIGNLLGF